MAERKGKGGRPRQGDDAKLQPLNMRTDPELRRLIEEAAERTGRSLTQEVERRLRTSFIMEEYIGGSHVHALIHTLGAAVHRIEQRTGKRWTEDHETWLAVRAVMLRLLAWDQPNNPQHDALLEAFNRAETLKRGLERAERELAEYRHTRPPHARPIAEGEDILATPNALLRASLTNPRMERGAGRDDWSDDEKVREVELSVEVLEARNAELEALLAAARAGEASRATYEQAKELGNAEAEEMFAIFGPKVRPASG